MSALSIATQLVAQCEGCRLAPYLDVAGVPTVGYGNTYMPDGSHVTMTTPPITADQARQMLTDALADIDAQINHWLPAGMMDNERAACLSFAYNVGVGAFHTSTLLRMIQAGKMDDAAKQFGNWVFAGGKVVPGLVTRRKLEAGVFLGTVKIDPTPQPTAESEADQLNDASLAASRGGVDGV